MKFQSIVSRLAHTYNKAPQQACMIWGAPGCGKSAVGVQALPDALGLPREAVTMFRPSNHDPVDLTGLPLVTEDSTRWVTPDFLKQLNAKAEKFGRAIFLIDELNQSVPMMFNTLNGLMLDRHLGEFHLHPGVLVLGTGNRQSDKAASNRMPSHTANRLLHLDMESDLDGWTNWALGAGMPMWLIAFLRFKPALLNEFDADRRENPTERTWEMVGRLIGDEAVPMDLALDIATGLVGAGPAAEVNAFREAMNDMPSPDAVLLDPEGAAVPEKPSVRFAICGALAQRAKKDNFDSIVTYANRLPPEFSVLLVRDAFKLHKEIASTKAFIEWVSVNQDVL